MTIIMHGTIQLQFNPLMHNVPLMHNLFCVNFDFIAFRPLLQVNLLNKNLTQSKINSGAICEDCPKQVKKQKNTNISQFQ